MLEEIKELQQNAVTKLVKETLVKKEVTFKAPTGSGKTYMMADFMDRILDNSSINISSLPLLQNEKGIIFLVSSLSKGKLAKQNFDKFIEYKEKGFFKNINPYLISSEISGEEKLYIPTDYNVYVLPRDLYKTNARLMQGAMESFLQNIVSSERIGGQGKSIILIKDECHIATNNLDNLSKYFDKVINMSATPKLKRGQISDVEIKEDEAVNTKLIKHVEWQDIDEELNASKELKKVIEKYEEVKEQYNNLGINPCLIIQISNKDKADNELNNVIKPVLNSKPNLKWMLIVSDKDEYDTNDIMKIKKLPKEKWGDYVKENTSSIDIIIFKMVITEGFDIPRACMLYQIRDSKSKQLDEQVLGRIRRNPRLLDFEKLTPEQQDIVTKAYVWGVQEKEKQTWYKVELQKDYEISNNIKIKTTTIGSLTERKDFDLNKFLNEKKDKLTHTSIFELAKKIKKSSNDIQQIINDYSSTYQKWYKISENIDELIKKNNEYVCDYSKSMKVNKEEITVPDSSEYLATEYYTEIENCIWKKSKASDDEFAFDSEAEKKWAIILKKLSDKKGLRKKNLLEDKIYLWGKNYIPNSKIKFEYYMNSGIHSSYPDFIMVDKKNNIHLFEIKSLNPSNSIQIDKEEYENKIRSLKEAYKVASSKTKQYFYICILEDNNWNITRFKNGEENNYNIEQFKSLIN